jgi:hypothetical protein
MNEKKQNLMLFHHPTKVNIGTSKKYYLYALWRRQSINSYYEGGGRKQKRVKEGPKKKSRRGK